MMTEEQEGWEYCDSGEAVLTDARRQHATKKINILEHKSTHRACIAVWGNPARCTYRVYVPQLETTSIINIHFSGAETQ